MRHYYRFMELEPVMELEEDSVGDESPTSSTGSPSFSPPPDVWAQLSGKEYQESAYNLLLQDHLELQRAYRLLEVQFRNSETRSARDLTESSIHVRHLKDTLKEVILTQETDKLLAMKEDLQRSKEREEKLKAEAYDLREQNELLEFRILELEECHENSSLRGVTHETRDVGTDMSDDVISLRETSPLNERQNTDDERTPDSLLTGENQLGNIQQCEMTACTNNERKPILESTITPSSDKQHGNMTAQSQTNLRQSVSNDQADQQKRLKTTEEGLWMKTNIITEDSLCRPEITSPLTNFSSESISCTLCRNASRRRSLPCSLVGVVDVENQKETLRKSKSAGEIKKMSNDMVDIEPRISEIVKERTNKYSDVVDKSLLINTNNNSDNNNPQLRKKGKMNCMRKLHDFVDAELSLQTKELNQTSATSSHKSYDKVSSKKDEQLLKMLKSIHDILKETRIEVECTNSELREEVVTLESTVITLTQERMQRRDSLHEEEDEGVKKLKELFSRSNSLSSSEECHCCTQQLRPTLEDVISKLQQLTDLVVNKELIKSSNAIIQSSETTSESLELVLSNSIESSGKELPAVICNEDEQLDDVLEICTRTTEKHVIKEDASIETEEIIISSETEMSFDSNDVQIPTNELIEAINKDILIIREIPTTLNIIQVEMPAEITSSKTHIAEIEHTVFNQIAKTVTIQQSEHKTTVERLKTDAQTMPIIEGNNKPVLRRWKEHLNDRPDRVKSWNGGDIDFPKRFQSATVK